MTRYNGSFLFEPIRALVASIFDKIVTALAAGGKRVLKVLEVGAGKATTKIAAAAANFP